MKSITMFNNVQFLTISYLCSPFSISGHLLWSPFLPTLQVFPFQSKLHILSLFSTQTMYLQHKGYINGFM